jgi:hypothetical protein
MENISKIARYFDLNRKVDLGLVPKQKEWSRGPDQQPHLPEVMLGAREQPSLSANGRTPSEMGWFEQFILYLGSILGVFASAFIHKVGRDGTFNILSHGSINTLIVSFFMSLAIIPITYRTLEVPREAPFFIRFTLFFEHGVFWQVITEFAGRLA